MTASQLVTEVSGQRDAVVLLLGDINVDLILELAEYPRPGGDGVASSQRIGLGGSAANSAIMLRRLGLRPSMLSAIGEDRWAEVAVEALRAEGVGLEYVVRDPHEPTSLNVIGVTPDGERTMMAYRGANPRYSPAHLPEEAIAACDFLHVSGYAFLQAPQSLAAVRAIEVATANGVPVSLDIPVDPARREPATIRRLLRFTDLLVVGVPEAQQLVGTAEPAEACRRLCDLGAKTVALKVGRDGTIIATADELVELPGLSVRTVDTTGAGDSFCAGAIAATLAALPLAKIGAVANLLGAAAVEKPGAGRSLPTLDELQRIEQRQPIRQP
ncbi:carbohydrate kinase family protein [Micromonospora sp. NPDC006431]|uniref:carbohydrate kinase family protein n=1 Tax=Micromonospora sp. NPDC006431 TaxID=3364235 RepID=UPI0036B6D91E